jgi:hypothetical protein
MVDCHDNSVGIVAGYNLEGPRIKFQGEKDFLQPFRPALEPNQPPVQWYRVIPRSKMAGTWHCQPTPF